MKKVRQRYTAIVKFIGNPKEYLIGKYCYDEEWLFCHACQEIAKQKCNRAKISLFKKNKKYKAYFLDYCQGVRDVLDVETETGEVESFIPLSDFQIISDEDDVLSEKYAVVECINANNHEDLTEGKQYQALKQKGDCFYVLDNTSDCYYYSKNLFKVVEDKDGILNDNNSWWYERRKS